MNKQTKNCTTFKTNFHQNVGCTNLKFNLAIPSDNTGEAWLASAYGDDLSQIVNGSQTNFKTCLE